MDTSHQSSSQRNSNNNLSTSQRNSNNNQGTSQRNSNNNQSTSQSNSTENLGLGSGQTPNTNPEWMVELKRDFHSIIIEKCSEQTRNAIANNDDIKVPDCDI